MRFTIFYSLHTCSLGIQTEHPKADPGPARRARAPLFDIHLGFIFVKIDSITYLNYSHHTLFTIILYSHYKT